MDVAVNDQAAGRRRMIKYRWKTKGTATAPPKHWYESVVGEVRFQRGQDGQEASGRKLPFE
jgi:hypothetical protein